MNEDILSVSWPSMYRSFKLQDLLLQAAWKTQQVMGFWGWGLTPFLFRAATCPLFLSMLCVSAETRSYFIYLFIFLTEIYQLKLREGEGQTETETGSTKGPLKTEKYENIWEKMFANCIFNEGWASQIYKKPSKLNKKNKQPTKTIQTESGWTMWANMSLEKVPRWQMSTRSDLQHHRPLRKCKLRP